MKERRNRRMRRRWQKCHRWRFFFFFVSLFICKQQPSTEHLLTQKLIAVKRCKIDHIIVHIDTLSVLTGNVDTRYELSVFTDTIQPFDFYDANGYCCFHFNWFYCNLIRPMFLLLSLFILFILLLQTSEYIINTSLLDFSSLCCFFFFVNK